MSLDPISAGLDLANTVVKTIWPDKSEQERAQIAAAVQLVQGQLDINKAEAASPSLLVAGWRPFIGWVCGAACAWNWVGMPVAKFACAFVNHPLALSAADLTDMLPLLLGMLGLGGLRTYEKVKGAA